MAGGDWVPDNALERDLMRLRGNGDGTGYARRLARADLVLPLLPEEATAGVPVSWVTAEISGTPHILAFTSPATMHRLLDDPEVPHRVARFVELHEAWPDPRLPLAVDPGLPIEAFLSRPALAEFAEVAAEPAPGLEQALYRAIAAGDVGAYTLALLEGSVAVPLDPRLGTAQDVADPRFPWARMEGNGELDGSIVLFSSPTRLRDQLGDHPHVVAAFALVAKAWPDPGTGLAVDPGTPLAAVLDGRVVAAIGERVGEFERITGDAVTVARSRSDLTVPERVALAEQVIHERFEGAAPASGTGPAGTAVQVFVPAGQLDRYLQQGHGRVAGLVHRAPGGAVPLAQLYARLGLLGEGSPFGADDDHGYVLRWVEPDPAAYPSPTMDGVELPGGATLLAIDRAGAERPIAAYRPGHGWYAAPATP
ncbi:MAG: hypothetical protein AUG49_13680 [Catenulispora sp. 13_1_20CM_3_70_7]|nr:MAG: hypothetical protein AUG49_13680 [Catenulispora sp. 13_1_20CM_3_70_7]